MQDLLLKVWCSSVTRLQHMTDSEHGATAVEYALMVGLIATIIVVVVKGIGGRTTNSFNTVKRAL